MIQAQFTFSDKSISYDTFMRDLSARIVTMLKEDKDDPDMISQRKAFELYGKGNVLRWTKTEAVQVCRRPGKIEYPSARLRELSRTDEVYIRYALRKK